MISRVIPCLLFDGEGLVKTRCFRDPFYVGDPINTIKIFNDKEVDEIVVLDINATREERPIRFDALEELAGESFMPMGYGGGIKTLADMERLFAIGMEKVIVNSSAAKNEKLVTEAAEAFGSQSVVVSIDWKKNWLGKNMVFVRNGSQNLGVSPTDYAKKVERLGAGEILLTAIGREGTYKGYDLAMTAAVADAVRIPVISNGGARGIEDFAAVVKDGHASAAAAGNVFVFHGRNRSVLIDYPERKALVSALGT